MGYTDFTKAISSVIFCRVPPPPGTIKTSISLLPPIAPLGTRDPFLAKYSANVSVGMILSPKPGVPSAFIMPVVTGAKLLLKTDRVISVEFLYIMASVLSTSIGPKTSRAWKCGNTRMPKCVGRVVVLAKGGWVGAA